ncbi:MAG: hypothetical protein N4A68_12415 [Maledivibacter sp.]|nr:hypothetical protein [Maledivibacter sp.]
MYRFRKLVTIFIAVVFIFQSIVLGSPFLAQDIRVYAEEVHTDYQEISIILKLISKTDKGIELSWKAATEEVDIAEYEIYRDEVKLDATDDLDYTDNEVDPEITYSYRIKAKDEQGNNIGGSNTLEVTTEPMEDTKAPTAPQNLTYVIGSDNSIKLSWEESKDDKGIKEYEVYNHGQLAYTTGDTHFTVRDVISDTAYTFAVKAVDGAGNESELSNSVEVAITNSEDNENLDEENIKDQNADNEEIESNNENISKSINLTTSRVTDTIIELSWDKYGDISDVAQYEIYRDEIKLKTTTDLNYPDGEVQPETTYSYMIRAKDSEGKDIARSNTLKVTTKPIEDSKIPTAPKNLAYRINEDNSVDLSWEKETEANNDEINEYEIYDDGELVYTTGDTHFTVKGLITDKPYVFTVKAKDKEGSLSGASNSVEVILTDLETGDDIEAEIEPETINLVALKITDKSVELSWVNSTNKANILEYEIYRNETKLGITTDVIYTDNGVQPQMTYSYFVKAKDVEGKNISKSNTVEITTDIIEETNASQVPQNLTYTINTDNTVDISWQKPRTDVEIKEYEIYKNTELVGKARDTHFKVIGLAPDISYIFTVKARDAKDNLSEASNPLEVILNNSALQNLVTTATTDTTAELTWDKVDNPHGEVIYDIYMGDTLVDTLVDTVHDTNYIAKDLSPNTAYLFSVVTKDESGKVLSSSNPLEVITEQGKGTIDIFRDIQIQNLMQELEMLMPELKKIIEQDPDYWKDIVNTPPRKLRHKLYEDEIPKNIPPNIIMEIIDHPIYRDLWKDSLGIDTNNGSKTIPQMSLDQSPYEGNNIKSKDSLGNIPEEMGEIVQVHAYYDHTLALDDKGIVWTWGYNGYGQLGDGTTKNSGTPVKVRNLSGVKAVSSGSNHSIALKEDGTVWTWGNNSDGQLGDGTIANRYIPVKVRGLSGVKAVSGGYNHSIALKEDGTVWTWGDNNDGQLGDGAATDRSIPAKVSGLSGVKAVVGGMNHSIALKEDGTVWTWGDNSDGQLGDGTITDRSIPVQVSDLNEVKAVSAGHYHSIALREDETVWTWGDNSDGQLGNGTTIDRSIPVQISDLSGVKAVSAGGRHSIALREDGTVWTWGRNNKGQLGDKNTTDRGVPVQVSSLDGVKAVSGGRNHSIALKEYGIVWAWGDNEYGQLGDGRRTQRSTPVQVSDLSGVKAVAGGWGHSLGVKEDGTVYTWGINSYGQLGDGTTINRSIPVEESILNGVKAVAGGVFHSLALTEDGTVWAWGWNIYGQLGDGTTIGRYTPQSARISEEVKAVAAGGGYSIALREDGKVCTWGSNSYGQLGNGTTRDSCIPEDLSRLSEVKAVAAGWGHSIALKEDGTVWTWGKNSGGQLGDGTTVNRSIPQEVRRLWEIKAVAAGMNHSIALREDGTVWTWGDNRNGQLGDGTTIDRSSPIRVKNLSEVKAIAVGAGGHCIALREDGTVWTWGDNREGQLGDETMTHRSVPVKVRGLSEIKEVAGGWKHSIALREDGTVWTWGNNNYGQLGDGCLFGTSKPILVIYPALAIIPISPQNGELFTKYVNEFKPTISIISRDNSFSTCFYYIDQESTPKDTKTVSETSFEEKVTFTPVNISTLSEGDHTITFIILNGWPYKGLQKTVNFKVKKSGPIVDLGNSPALIYEYDDKNELKTIKNKLTNTIIYEFIYDNNGNILRINQK